MIEPSQIPAQTQRNFPAKPFTGADDPRRWKSGNKSKPRVADAFWRIANRQLEGVDRKELDELCQAIWDKAKRGDSKCAALVFDRMEGKAVQPVEDVTPQQDATPEEIRERIKRLAVKLASEGVNADAG